MGVNYDNLWKLLIDKNMKRTDLIHEAKISSSALANMGKNNYVSLRIIDKICTYLDCNVEDILTIEK